LNFGENKSSAGYCHKKESSFFVLLIFFISVGMCWALFRNQFPRTYDHSDSLVYHLIMRHYFGQGQFLPVWTPALNHGYGGALFNFYPPLFYLSSALLDALGFPIALAINITCFLAIFFSAWAMFIFLKELINVDGAFLGAVAYMMAPYHTIDLYARGAYPEIAAFVFLPLIFWGVRMVACEPRFRYFSATAFAVCGLLLSHTITAVFFLPLAGLYAICLSFIQREAKLRKCAVSISSVLAGFALAAFSIVPAVLEKKYLNLEPYISGWFDYHRNFIHPAQLIFSPQQYSSWLPVSLANNLPFQFPWSYLLFFVLGMVCVWSLASKEIKKEYAYLLIALLATVWMMTIYSRVVWGWFPVLWSMQFPWRLMAPTSFLVCAFMACIGFIPVLKYRRIICIIGVVLIIITRMSDFKTLGWFPPVSKSPETLNLILPSGGDSQPAAAKVEISKVPDHLMDFPRGIGEVVSHQEKSPVWHTFQIITETPVIACFYNFYFPGWEIYVDGQKTPLIDNGFGLILFEITAPGTHQIDIRFTATGAHILGNSLSLICLLGMIGMLVIRKTQMFKRLLRRFAPRNDTQS